MLKGNAIARIAAIRSSMQLHAPSMGSQDKSETYIASIVQEMSGFSSNKLVDHIEGVVRAHDGWRRTCLNMNPAESGLSSRARAILASDMATRLSEGKPGDKVYPHGRQNRFIDEIEAIIVSLVRKQFDVRFVEWRPISTSMANAAVFFSLLKPGDTALVQAEDGGGNFSYHENGPLGLARARIVDLPFHGDSFEIDMDGARDVIRREHPKLIVVGGSNVLFPYPVRDLRKLADEIGALLVYDAAHLGLLIASGLFQNPLEEGAHILTVSTHKIMGGPVGGLILTNEEPLAKAISETTFPGFLQTRDQNKYAALAVVLSEMKDTFSLLGLRMRSNARRLAAELSKHKFDVIAAHRNYTDCHQIFLRLGANARTFELRCQAANILFADCALTGEIALGRRTGVRMATHEITRAGLTEDDMTSVAKWMAQAFQGREPESISREITSLLENRCPPPSK